MIFLPNRLAYASCLAVALLSYGTFTSCQNPKPDQRDELVRSLKGANTDNFHFASKEDDTQVTTSLTNNALRNLVTLDRATNNLVLRYTSVRDKRTNATKTYKTEIARAGNALTLVVTDIATNEVFSRDTFPSPQPHGGDQKFDSLEACLKDFDCKHKGALLCEANRTCKPQFAALTCCLTNGQCFSVHLVIKPTSLKCLLADVIPDLEGIVLSP